MENRLSAAKERLAQTAWIKGRLGCPGPQHGVWLSNLHLAESLLLTLLEGRKVQPSTGNPVQHGWGLTPPHRTLAMCAVSVALQRVPTLKCLMTGCPTLYLQSEVCAKQPGQEVQVTMHLAINIQWTNLRAGMGRTGCSCWRLTSYWVFGVLLCCSIWLSVQGTS